MRDLRRFAVLVTAVTTAATIAACATAAGYGTGPSAIHAVAATHDLGAGARQMIARSAPATSAPAMEYSSSSTTDSSAASYGDTPPLRAVVVAPARGARAGAGGTFSVEVEIQARTSAANGRLRDYKPGFVDPNSPQFHPGPDAFAPGLVVLLSTTPSVDGTPLQGPNTNLAGVFQINDVFKLNGRKSSFNSWLVGVPGFFGRNTTATLTVFAVSGTAPAVVTGHEHPISNVVRETFTIAP